MKDNHCGDIDYTQLKRRSFFGRLLFGVATITGLAGLLTGLRVLSPNVLYETPKKIKVGMPEEIQIGVTYFKEAKAFVFKEKKVGGQVHFSAVSAACTHLGCIVQYTPGLEHAGTKVAFSCGCHGSKYTINGKVVKGPAPKPLVWFNLELAIDDGQLIVDTGTVVKRYTSITV